MRRRKAMTRYIVNKPDCDVGTILSPGHLTEIVYLHMQVFVYHTLSNTVESEKHKLPTEQICAKGEEILLH